MISTVAPACVSAHATSPGQILFGAMHGLMLSCRNNRHCDQEPRRKVTFNLEQVEVIEFEVEEEQATLDLGTPRFNTRRVRCPTVTAWVTYRATLRFRCRTSARTRPVAAQAADHFGRRDVDVEVVRGRVSGTCGHTNQAKLSRNVPSRVCRQECAVRVCRQELLSVVCEVASGPTAWK